MGVALYYDKPELAMYLVKRGSSVRAKDYDLHVSYIPVICMAIQHGMST